MCLPDPLNFGKAFAVQVAGELRSLNAGADVLGFRVPLRSTLCFSCCRYLQLLMSLMATMIAMTTIRTMRTIRR